VPLSPADEAIVTMCPWSAAIICGSVALTVQKCAVAFTAIVSSCSESEPSSSFLPVTMPALLTRIVHGPAASAACAIAA